MNEAILLLDSDPLVYAGSFVGQDNIKDDDGKVIDVEIHPFSFVSSYLDNLIPEIMEACNTTIDPLMFLSGDTNFRNEVAKKKVYKGNRKKERPFHYDNTRVYIRSRYTTNISNGVEADDVLAMFMTKYRREDIPCILVSIDKDLRQVEGWHYTYETWNSGEKPLYFVDKLGKLEEKDKNGYLFFCYQLLTGDSVDNIPGLPRYGPKKAFKFLHESRSPREAFNIVANEYKEVYSDTWREELSEQCNLLWMIREVDKGGIVRFNLEEHLNGW